MEQPPVGIDKLTQVFKNAYEPIMREQLARVPLFFQTAPPAPPLTRWGKVKRWNRNRHHLYIRFCKPYDWTEPGHECW